MKKLFLFIGILSMPFLNAQDITDALRYSQQDILGTARFRGMSGAFGALGGDLSALQINPAGSAVFLNSYGSFTLSKNQVNNDATYFNTINSTNSNNVNFNQVGTVFIYNNYNNNDSGINKLSLGIVYDQTSDNANEFFVSGRSSNSIDNFFLSEAQGISQSLISRRSGETVRSNLF